MSSINNHQIIISEQSFQEPSTSLLDFPKRIQYNRCLWHSIFHRKERNALNVQIWQIISSFFQERYDIKNPHHFKRIWKEIGNKIWSKRTAFTVGHLRAIDEEFKTRLIYHGPGSSSLSQNKAHINTAIQEVVHTLLHGGKLSFNTLTQKSLWQAVLFKQDPVFLKQFRMELQLELDHLAKNPPKNAQEEFVWRQFLGNVLALLPFSYPVENETFIIPHLDLNGTCLQVPYNANIIELTPAHNSTPISAIGLTPIDDKQASPILSFIGTTYPAGNGFSATIKADFTPKMSVGEKAYEQGKEKIAAWLKNKTNVHIVGTSLGGALTFHTILDHYSSLSRADVYNPPGLYARCWKNRSFDEGCPINIYRQAGDIVSMMGFWPTGSKVKIYNTIPHQKGIKEGMPRSHAQVFSGCQRITLLKSDPSAENKSLLRKVLVVMHRYLGPYVFYYPTCFILSCHRMIQAAQRCWKSLFKKKI